MYDILFSLRKNCYSSLWQKRWISVVTRLKAQRRRAKTVETKKKKNKKEKKDSGSKSIYWYYRSLWSIDKEKFFYTPSILSRSRLPPRSTNFQSTLCIIIMARVIGAIPLAVSFISRPLARSIRINSPFSPFILSSLWLSIVLSHSFHSWLRINIWPPKLFGGRECSLILLMKIARLTSLGNIRGSWAQLRPKAPFPLPIWRKWASILKH